MNIVWAHGESCVQDVLQRLDTKLAYTTVMTTMDRLFKKGILTRRRADRAFLYSAVLPKPEWERQVANSLISRYLEGVHSPELLVSSFVDALGKHDELLLDELERKIRKKRKDRDRKKGRA